MLKWLFVTADPWPMHHGTALRVFHLARELAAVGDRVTILTDWQGAGAFDAYRDAGVAYETIAHRAAGTRETDGGVYPVNAHFGDALRARAGHYDAVVLFAAELLQYAPFCRECRRVVADVIDDPVLAAWRRLRRPSSLRWALRNLRLLWDLRRYEKPLVPAVDLFIFVTDVDAGTFQRRNPRVTSVAIANGVAFARKDRVATESVAPYLVFVGNYAFVPNRTAAEFLARKVAPLVWAGCPEVRFRFVGGNPPEWLQAHSDTRIEVTGFVDDVGEHLFGARGVVIPMVTGTGIKNKLLEAWAARKPVVATPLACQGVPAVDGENLLLGRGPREIVAAIIRIWTDAVLAERLAESGNSLVASHFSWPSMAAKLKEAVLARWPSRLTDGD